MNVFYNMQRLLLIDSRVSDVESILATLTPETDSIIFDYYSDTLETIQSKIVKPYVSVAIAQHKYGNPTFQLVASMSPASLDNLEETDPELASWSEFSAFVLWLKNNGADTVDLLACDLWADMNWRYAIQKMRDTMNMTIRASIDITGADGNFILESDNVDMVGLYFTPEISNYKYNFGTNDTVSPMDFGRSSTTMFVPVTLPTSNAGTVPATSYSAFIGSFSNSTGYSTITSDVSNVVSVCITEKSVALLKSNGSVFTYGQTTGTADTGGNSSSVQSRLNNITKIVSTLDGFAALRSDGLVIPWGVYATSTDSTTYILYSDISNTLVNITNIWSSENAVIALNTSGKIITFGRKANGGQIPSGYVNYLNSGVIKVATSQTSQLYIKSDGTAYVITGTVGTNSLSTLYNTNPIVDGIMARNNAVVIRSPSDNTKQITNLDGSTLHYTIPSGVSIVKTLINNKGTSLHLYILLSNNVLLIINPSVTVVDNVTDVAINEEATAYIKDGSVVVTGRTGKSDFGTDTTNTTYGLPNGRTLTNIRRLVSSSNSLGALSFDGTFTWWGSIPDTLVTGTTLTSSDFPTRNTTTTQMYNKLTSNVASVYSCNGGYVFTCLDGSMVSLGIKNFQGMPTNKATTNFSTKNAGKNVYFVPNEEGVVPIDITPVVTSSISPGQTSVNNTVTYYNSNPDVMALAGRKYTLYNGTTLLSTWYCINTSFTYTFTNVVLSSSGSISLSIYDSPDYTTNKSLIGTFNETVTQTSSTVPDPPTITTSTFVSNIITVNFTAPTSNGGSAILGYKYSYDLGINYTTIADPNATQFVVSNMTSLTYTIWLKAYNSVGDSSYAERVVTMTPLDNKPTQNPTPKQDTPTSTITYSYSPSYLLPNSTFIFTINSITSLTAGTYYLKKNALQTLSTMEVSTTTNSITFTNVSTDTFTIGTNTLFLYKSSGGAEADILISNAMVVNVACFLEGTKILTFDTRRNKLRYIPIEKLKPGMRVKTLSSGFVPIKHIGYSTMYNPGLSTRVKDQLFIYKKTAYPELIEDLVLTGTHSILVEEITDTERTDIIDTLGKIYITEDRYRLPAFNDTRAERYEHRGEFRIWNLALENNDYTGNYGIYANGLLVETTSCRYITELSGMTLIH
jgi:hypothetical protein